MEAARAGGSSEVIRVFRLDPKATNFDLTEMVTAIRTTADLQRLFPFETGKAVILRGPSDPVAVAEWLIHEMGKPSDPRATHETSLPGVTDGVVRLFFVGQKTSVADLTALVTQIRTTTGIMRLFPLLQSPAVLLRGRPDQISTAELLVNRFAASVH
jgi:hypothetical protein